ncbi:MAG: GTP cyclohydrolase [Rhodospirillales bacterium]|nr:GTP cyclohydrolase [Alphaproteobacteria bacterium]MCB9986658.1 GTP cyclohydrolase [Rhodospirillales bacterium]USO06814.1 MAG: GTP cyclohydrolase [Rhodospirillales bacterium]
MYIVMLHYKVALDVMDRHRPAHLEWLKQGYEQGMLLASGRQTPPTGGVILAHAMPRAELDAYLARDPFKTADLADYTIVEFAPNLRAPELSGVE